MRPIRCPVCGELIMPVGNSHPEKGCWWTRGCVWQGKAQPEPLTLWQRIKKHGLKARIF